MFRRWAKVLHVCIGGNPGGTRRNAIVPYFHLLKLATTSPVRENKEMWNSSKQGCEFYSLKHRMKWYFLFARAAGFWEHTSGFVRGQRKSVCEEEIRFALAHYINVLSCYNNALDISNKITPATPIVVAFLCVYISLQIQFQKLLFTKIQNVFKWLNNIM